MALLLALASAPAAFAHAPTLPSRLAIAHVVPRHSSDATAQMPAAQLALTALRGGQTLPSLSALAFASSIPTCLGFWKTGYAVSYGYGGAMAAAGALMLRTAGLSPLAKAHAIALLVYGVRLNTFLLYRELALPEEVHQMKQRKASLSERLKRAPVIIGCSALYFFMAAPLRVTALAHGGPLQYPLLAPMAIAMTFLGFGIAASGDIVKSAVKAKEGAAFLVTSGPFRWLRHPNYTGELTLANCH